MAWGPAAFWGDRGRIFRNFVHFWGILDTSYVILVFVTDIFRFWMDFGWFLEGFGKVFGGPFRRFFTFFAQIATFCESQQNTAWAHEFSRSTFQKTRKFPKKMPEKIDEIIWLEKTRAKFTQILNLGRSWAYQAQVWEGLGILLGAFGRLLVVFWTF